MGTASREHVRSWCTDVQAAWATRLPQHWALWPRLLPTLADDGTDATVAPPVSKATQTQGFLSTLCSNFPDTLVPGFGETEVGEEQGSSLA